MFYKPSLIFSPHYGFNCFFLIFVSSEDPFFFFAQYLILSQLHLIFNLGFLLITYFTIIQLFFPLLFFISLEYFLLITVHLLKLILTEKDAHVVLRHQVSLHLILMLVSLLHNPYHEKKRKT